jgi:glycosyltransferase involved in cell wall biosynthesis
MDQKLSIITVNLNNSNGLQKTIESVEKQTYSDFEFIVIDGGSTDGSMDLIKSSDRITYWISEPDKGIYNAMNKGIERAKGEYCFFLNSGDWFSNEKVLEKFLTKGEGEDFLFGNVDTDRGIRKAKEKITFFTFYSGTIIHQSVFTKRSLFLKYGTYDETLTIVADWEFFLRTIINDKCTYRYIDETICRYEYTGVSSDLRNHEKLANQRQQVLKTMYPMMYDDYLVFKNADAALHFYVNSWPIQQLKKILQSKIYNCFRKLFNFK